MPRPFKPGLSEGSAPVGETALSRWIGRIRATTARVSAATSSPGRWVPFHRAELHGVASPALNRAWRDPDYHPPYFDRPDEHRHERIYGPDH